MSMGVFKGALSNDDIFKIVQGQLQGQNQGQTANFIIFMFSYTFHYPT